MVDKASREPVMRFAIFFVSIGVRFGELVLYLIGRSVAVELTRWITTIELGWQVVFVHSFRLNGL